MFTKHLITFLAILTLGTSGAFAKEAAKSMKTEKDLSDFSRMLKKVTVEAPLRL